MKYVTITVPFPLEVRRSDDDREYVAYCRTLDLDGRGVTADHAVRACADRIFAMYASMHTMREPRPPRDSSVPAEAVKPAVTLRDDARLT